MMGYFFIESGDDTTAFLDKEYLDDYVDIVKKRTAAKKDV